MSDRNLRQRGRIYWYRIRHKGHDFEGSLETDNKAQARIRLGRKLEELKGTSWGENPKRTLSEICKRFERDHYPHLKAGTQRVYRCCVATLLEFFGEKFCLADLSSQIMLSFEASRRATGASTSTVRGDFAVLSSIWASAKAWEWIDKPNPITDFVHGRAKHGGLKEGAPRERWLTIEEELEILRCAPPKAATAIEFAIETGLRKEEQLSLLRSDINMQARQLTVRPEVAKNKKRRHVPLSERAMAILRGLPISNRSPHVFVPEQGEFLRYSSGSPTLYEALQKAVRRANKARAARGLAPMPHVEWHDLRRTCGCRLLQDKGFSMEQVQKWLGHSSVIVTERHYAFLEVAQLHKRLREAESRSGAKVGTLGSQSNRGIAA